MIAPISIIIIIALVIIILVLIIIVLILIPITYKIIIVSYSIIGFLIISILANKLLDSIGIQLRYNI